MSVPASPGSTIRYLAVDPALSCGFAIIQLDASAQIISIDVGVLEVDKSVTVDGARCLSLQEQLRPLLSPPPDHAFIEPFFGRGRQGEPISFKLRAVIEMELASRSIEYTEVAPQTWKKAMKQLSPQLWDARVQDGMSNLSNDASSEDRAKAKSKAEKVAAKAAVEQKTGFSFPERLFIRGRWLQFRLDASDATAIGLCGVLQRGPLTFADSLRVSAPGLPRPRPGKPYEPTPPSQIDTAASAASPAVVTADTDAASGSGEASTNQQRSKGHWSMEMVRDPWQCTLAEGCTLLTGHPGHCQCAATPSGRSKAKPDFVALSRGASKRPRPDS